MNDPRRVPAPDDAAGATAQAPRGRLLTQSIVSILDQGWLSALNLGVGLLLIRLATKEDYGIYAQLFVGGLLATTIIDALITNPLTTLSASLHGAQRHALLARLARFQRQLALAIAVLTGIACVVATHLGAGGPAWLLGLCFAAYVYANARREYQRSMGFIDGRPDRVFRTDLIYGLGVIVGAALLAWQQWLNLPALFAVLTLASVAALRTGPALPHIAHDPVAYRQTLQTAWLRGKHALPGATASWVINYSYLYVTALWLGVTASADLSASRLLLMPVSLCVVAWARVACPMMGRLLAQAPGRLGKLLLASSIGLELLAAGYLLVLWLALPWLERHVLSADYLGLDGLVIAWGLYFIVYSARWIATALLMAADRYLALLRATLAGLALLVVVFPIALSTHGTIGAVAALAIAEAFTLGLLALIARPLLRRLPDATSPQP